MLNFGRRPSTQHGPGVPSELIWPGNPSARSRRPAQVRRLVAGVAVVAAGLSGVALAAPASAGTCSTPTGGSSNTLIFTGSTYACGYVAGSGNKSIGAFDTQTWTSSTALGYTKRYTCDGQSGGVSISSIYSDSGGTSLGSSITYTAFNTTTGGRHWNAAALWNTSSAASSQYIANCGDNYSIAATLVYISNISMTGPTTVTEGGSVAMTATVTAPDGGGPATGTVALFRQKGATIDPETKNCAGTVVGGTDTPIGSGTLSNGVATLHTPPTLPVGVNNVYAVYAGTPVTSSTLPSFCLAPPQSGLTPAIQTTAIPLTVEPEVEPGSVEPAERNALAQADLAYAGKDVITVPQADPDATRVPNPKLTVVDVKRTAPHAIAARCPKGTSAVQASVSSPTEILTDRDLATRGNGKVKVSGKSLPDGAEVDLQLVCRPHKAKAMSIGKAGYGSVRDDVMTSSKAKAFQFGGYGADTLTVSGKHSQAFGGSGNDLITLRAGSAAGTGGPGNDWIRSYSSGTSLIIGGLGNDVLIGGPGKTRINAVDGKGSDTVRCASGNRVIADRGDFVAGDCTWVKRR